MSRFLIIFLFTSFLFDTSCEQKPKAYPRNAADAAKSGKITFDITERSYIDSILKDTLFLKTFGRPEVLEAGEFVSAVYKIELPPKPTSWTSDYERIFTKEQIDSLNIIISEFESQTSYEIAVITIDKRWTIDEKFDSLITAIGNYWGVGKKDKNNGIVIGISAGLRRIRISNGYGIETKLSDSETKKIIDEAIIPYFKEGNFFEGVQRGLFEIMRRLR